MWDNEIINKALFYSCTAHKNQLMENKGVPYCAHIMGVLLTIINNVEDQELNWNLLAPVALLHDTIEDTQTTYQDLEKEFGKQVADGVWALTKDENLPVEEQMKNCMQKILQLPKEIAIVKLADRCFNTRDFISYWSTKKRINYLLEAEMISKILGKFSPKLNDLLQSNIQKLKKAIKED